MAAPCLPIQLPPLDNKLGAAFIGTIMASILYGVTNLQTYRYFDINNDGILLRSLVSILWVLDTLHLLLIAHTLYHYMVTNFSNPLVITTVTWSIMLHVAITGVSDFLIRGIFAYRVYRLSGRNKWLTSAIIATALLVLGTSITFSVRGWQLGAYADFTHISWVLYTAFGAGVVADSTIAIALCIFLARHRTSIKRTNSIVRSLMLYSINTGALTSICALTVLITYSVMPDNFVFIALYFALPKLFLNSLLATLNARQKLRDGGTGSSNLLSIPLSGVEFTTGPILSSGMGRPGANSVGDRSFHRFSHDDDFLVHISHSQLRFRRRRSVIRGRNPSRILAYLQALGSVDKCVAM
ncbi:hypothetical protein BDW22DRAFT_1040348 [Trametopsis cervina]|nr:hypothetical protein BDW22DRAFT_1040348 [Trametopsis cervina]